MQKISLVCQSKGKYNFNDGVYFHGWLKTIMNYQDINAETIDRWVKEGWEWGKAIDHFPSKLLYAIEGKWEIKLTPVKLCPAQLVW